MENRDFEDQNLPDEEIQRQNQQEKEQIETDTFLTNLKESL